MNAYFNPVRTYQGTGCLGMLPSIIQKAAPDDAHILLLLCMEDLIQNDVLRTLISGLQNRITVEYFSASNPDLEQLFEMYTKTKDLGIGLVVAIGGGSTLDVGKSLCCLYGEEFQSTKQLRDMLSEKKYGKPVCPWIGVPTTAGTGSEVTCWATIWNPNENRKYSLDTPENYAFAAVADPELLYSMPLGLAVSSALDAVAHATESYWAKASNVVSKALSLTAIRMIMGHIDQLIQNPDEKSAYQFMSQGSLLAGLAFSNTRTTACHSISYPLTMHYHIPHGVAVSLLLGPVMHLNYDKISDPLPLIDAYGLTATQQLDGKIKDILSRAGFHVTLTDWGVKESDLQDLAAHSITKGRADNNPADLTEAAVLKILKSIL